MAMLCSAIRLRVQSNVVIAVAVVLLLTLLLPLLSFSSDSLIA